MKNLKKPKILIPIIIVLVALGAFAATTMSGVDFGGHGHSHGEEHGHEH